MQKIRQEYEDRKIKNDQAVDTLEQNLEIWLRVQGPPLGSLRAPSGHALALAREAKECLEKMKEQEALLPYPEPVVHEGNFEVSKILPVFDDEPIETCHSLPIPQYPTFREQMIARNAEMAAARHRAMVSPIQQFYGKVE